MLDDNELELIKKRCAAASPGPWKWKGCDEDTFFELSPEVISALGQSTDSFWIRNKADIEFIPASRTDIPALLDTIAVYKKALELAGVEIAQLNVRGAYVTITDKVMPEYWLKQAEAEINV